jgi:predicted ATPase
MHLKRLSLQSERFPNRDVYPFNLPLLQQTGGLSLDHPVTFFVGENGTGKSTLLKALCQRCEIYIWQDTERSRHRYNRYEDELYKYLEVEWTAGKVPGAFFSSQLFQDFARFLDEWARADPGILAYFGGSSLLTQSHGQSLITFFESRYSIKGLYLMDEPETALSPKSQLKLLQVLKKATRGGTAQFIVATHSPILLAYPGAQIYSFDSVPVAETTYESTAYYTLYRDFLNHREKYLEELRG